MPKRLMTRSKPDITDESLLIEEDSIDPTTVKAETSTNNTENRSSIANADINTPVKRGNAFLANRLIANLFTPAASSIGEVCAFTTPSQHRDESMMEWEEASTPRVISEEVNTPSSRKSKKEAVLVSKMASSETTKTVSLVNSPVTRGSKQVAHKAEAATTHNTRAPDNDDSLSIEEDVVLHYNADQEDLVRNVEDIISEPAAELREVMEKSTRQKTASTSQLVCAMYADVGNFSNVFKHSAEVSDSVLNSLKALYSFSTTLEARPDDICTVFINDSDETVWQQISYRNRQISKEFKRYKTLLESKAELPGSFASTSDSEEELDDFQEDSMEDEVEDEDLDESCSEVVDDFEEKENLESASEPIKTRKYPRTPVDDKFFSLVEMNAFLDEQDRRSGEQDTFLDSVGDDSWGGQTSYRYEDFFGKLDTVAPSAEVSRKSVKRKAEDIEVDAKKKSVRFAIEQDVEQDEESGEDETEQEPVLLGNDTDTVKVETKLERNLDKLKDTIKKLEEENLKTRSWELSGEVAANEREDNTLLEKYVQFDHGAKKAPEITEDFTEKLECIILQRIEDKTFDDVLRKKKSEERTETYRNDAIEEQEMMKQSLAEVYEKEYQKTAGEVEANVKTNDEHTAIEKRMRELFRLIDALSHFEYTPPEVRPEVRIVNNMSAVRTEEVGMMASTDAQLLAPEEIKKRQKGELKTSEERDKTDKLRERRKKKNKQRSMVMKIGEKALSSQVEKKKKSVDGKSERLNANAGENLKSSNFFNQLQDTVRKEITEKSTKKKKIKSEKIESGGSKFKL